MYIYLAVNRCTHLLDADAAHLLGPRDRAALDLLQFDFCQLENGSVAVEEDHRGREVEEARGQDGHGVCPVEGLAYRDPLGVEEVSVPRDDEGDVERERSDPCETNCSETSLYVFEKEDALRERERILLPILSWTG